MKVTRLAEKLTKLKEEMGKPDIYEKQMLVSPDRQISVFFPACGESVKRSKSDIIGDLNSRSRTRFHSCNLSIGCFL